MPKVLLIDDEPYVLEGLKTMVTWKDYGLQICGEATNGEEGLEIFLANRPELVITDIRMPAMDGLELIKRVRAGGYSQVKFIIVSGFNEFTYAQQAMRYGVSAYLLKPLDDQELRNAIEGVSTSDCAADPEGFSLASDSEPADGWTTHFKIIQDTCVKEDFCYERIEGLLEEIRQNNYKRIDEQIKALFCFFAQNRYPRKIVKEYIRNLELEALKLVSNNMGEEFTSMQKEIGKKFLEFHDKMEYITGEEIEGELSAFCRDLTEYIGAIQDNKDIIGEVKAYIKEHYNQSITLQRLAERFYIHPVYLGQLFKKSAGRRFCDYLHQIRIEEAKKMLRKTNMKVAEVARATGYCNPDYFVRKFKSIVRVSPSVYKKINL